MTRRILSAGAVIVRRDVDHWVYLLLRAYSHWDFPKGVVEPGEDPLQAAVREVEEETTLNDLQFNWGHFYRETGPSPRGKVARYYVAETQTAQVYLPVSEELGRPEHDEYRWLAYAAARRLLKPRLAAVLDWSRDVVEGAPPRG